MGGGSGRAWRRGLGDKKGERTAARQNGTLSVRTWACGAAGDGNRGGGRCWWRPALATAVAGGATGCPTDARRPAPPPRVRGGRPPRRRGGAPSRHRSRHFMDPQGAQAAAVADGVSLRPPCCCRHSAAATRGGARAPPHLTPPPSRRRAASAPGRRAAPRRRPGSAASSIARTQPPALQRSTADAL